MSPKVKVSKHRRAGLSVRRYTRMKRINYSKLTPMEARQMIGDSRGMSKAKWERLYKIAWRTYTPR